MDEDGNTYGSYVCSYYLGGDAETSLDFTRTTRCTDLVVNQSYKVLLRLRYGTVIADWSSFTVNDNPIMLSLEKTDGTELSQFVVGEDIVVRFRGQ